MTVKVKSDERFMSRSQFAASQGWSPSYVTKLSRQRRLVFTADGRLVDAAASLELLARTRDPVRAAVRQHHQANRVAKHVTRYTRADAPLDDGEGAGIAAPEYWKSRAIREKALAELAQLDLAQRSGDLVDRARVEAVAFAAGRRLRDTLLGLPVRLAPVFANTSSAFEIERQLADALRTVLADAARMAADDLLELSTDGAGVAQTPVPSAGETS